MSGVLGKLNSSKSCFNCPTIHEIARGPQPQLNHDLIVRIWSVPYELCVYTYVYMYAYVFLYMYVYVYVYISGIPRDPESQRPPATIQS